MRNDNVPYYETFFEQLNQLVKDYRQGSLSKSEFERKAEELQEWASTQHNKLNS